jgi:hypothetical protein
MGLTLTTHDTGFSDPDAETIAAVLASLDGERHVLATLGHSDLTYVQVSGAVKTGFALEYQEGSLDQHYRSRAVTLPLDAVTVVFQKYARGDEGWRQGIDWEHVPAVRQSIPWYSTWVGYLVILAIAIAAIWFWLR